jgi:hypothetical protein
VDNGHPWASRGDLPTELALWLAGLDVELVYNRPRRPQENGVVERSQQTGQRWAEVGRCRSAAALQRRLDAMDAHQRAGFPTPEASPLVRHPGLAHSGRPFTAAGERKSWDAGKMKAAVAAVAVPRQVNARGLVSIDGHNDAVGKRSAGQTVYVRLDAAADQWVIATPAGVELTRVPAVLSLEAIQAFAVTCRHRHRRGPARQSSVSRRAAKQVVA